LRTGGHAREEHGNDQYTCRHDRRRSQVPGIGVKLIVPTSLD
jgi:hypothetical protein